MTFRHRGVIEGFYGPPWSHEDRLWVVERMGKCGMNRYVHAPKNDPLHRESWREPYPEDALSELAELVERGRRAGVDVGFAISPGLTIAYASAEDRRALARKLGVFRELGARLLCLALDDVPSRLVHEADRSAFASLAHAHVALAHAVRDAVPDAALYLVPTDYLGVEPTTYLEHLGAALDPAIEVGWTGRTVVSPTITAPEAARRAETLGRPLLVWDNTPVSDGPMRILLHLGPYTGRDRDLAAHVSGVLLNPMQHARASWVALRTAAAFLADPAGYDAERAWRRAVAELGEGAADAFEVFARAHRFSALSPDDRDRELETALARLRAALERDDAARPSEAAREVDALRGLLAPRLAAPAALREGLRDRRLLAEIEPWLDAYARETRRIEAAANLLATILGDAPPSACAIAFLGMQARLTREPETGRVSYGPRRAVYPQLVSMHDEGMGFGADPVLFRDRCLADAFVALAEEVALARLRRSG